MPRSKRPVAADKPRAQPKPKAKRGRPRKAAVPPAAVKVEVTLQQAMQAVLDDAMQRAATGKPLAHHHQQALRTAWMLDQSQYVWANVDAAAADLSVSPGTVRNYAAEGCPGIEPHQPIKKHVVYAWLLRNAHDRGGKPGATINGAEEIEVALRKAKLFKVSGQLVSDAEDRACQGVINRMGQLRHHLQNGLSGALFEVLVRIAGLDRPLADLDRTVIEDAFTQAIDAELQRFVPRRIGGAVVRDPSTTHLPPPTTAHGAQTQEPTHG